MSERARPGAPGIVALPVLAAALAWPLDPGAARQAAPCPLDPDPVGRAAADPDLYCMALLPTPRVLDARGSAELRRPPGPFSLDVTPDGRIRYRVVVTTEGLPDPSELGAYTTYVAWAASPVLTPVERLGEVPSSGSRALGDVAMNRFLLLVSAEARADVVEPTGPFVLRAQSPASRMQPADFLEFMLGATGVPEPADSVAAGGHGGAHAPGDGWGSIPMPAGITMLPAMMELRPRTTTPWLPGTRDDVVDARPRELIRLAEGDSLDLQAVVVRRRIGNRTLLGYGFNGQIPGPLLWVGEDATVTVRFTNRIDWPTSIHWHGVRLDNRFDGVPGVTQDPVLPGETFTYRVRFPDPGIYWYHPHHREDVQQDLGLAGNMIVESPDPEYYGPAHREEILMLDDLLLGEHGLVPYGLERATHALMGRFGNTMLVNGEPEYALETRPGEVVRFFFTNVSNTRTFNLSFPGARMKVVGTDVGNFEREAWIESLLITPAERYVVHVRFPERGPVPLVNRVQGIDHIAARFLPEVDTLGVVRVDGDPATGEAGRAFASLRVHQAARDEIARVRARAPEPPELELELDMETRDLPLVVHRLMQVDSAYFHPLEASGTMPMMNFMSTGEEVRWILRDPDTGLENEAIDWRFRVGDVVRLRLRNVRRTLHQMQHPIHIHGQRFLVLAVGGVPNDNLAWKDTVLVPVGSTVDLLLELSNPGRWMLHCHIAEHLEVGMKLVFTVEE